MKILAIDTSARAASAAVVADGRVLCESYLDVKLTHSETLMPMLDAMLRDAALALPQMDLLAVSAGPGSFTGLRIGISAVKGLAFPGGIPCVGVSTLEGLAYNLAGWDCVACAAMDARCKQVYTACFDVAGETVSRLTPDEALSLEELERRLAGRAREKPLVLVGDGAALCHDGFGRGLGLRLAPAQLRFQHANSVARAAFAHAGEAGPAGQLAPAYLRLPQAERELLRREAAGSQGRA